MFFKKIENTELLSKRRLLAVQAAVMNTKKRLRGKISVKYLKLITAVPLNILN
jgi:hypothetical protein